MGAVALALRIFVGRGLWVEDFEPVSCQQLVSSVRLDIQTDFLAILGKFFRSPANASATRWDAIWLQARTTTLAKPV